MYITKAFDDSMLLSLSFVVDLCPALNCQYKVKNMTLAYIYIPLALLSCLNMKMCLDCYTSGP